MSAVRYGDTPAYSALELVCCGLRITEYKMQEQDENLNTLSLHLMNTIIIIIILSHTLAVATATERMKSVLEQK